MEFSKVASKIQNNENLTIPEVKLFKEFSLLKARRVPNTYISMLILKFAMFYNDNGEYKGSL